MSGAEWVVPNEGHLSIQFVAEPMPPGPDLVGSDLGCEGLINNIKEARTDIERQKIFDKGVTNSDIYLTAKQAQTLLKECSKGMDPFDMIAKLLPQMAGPHEACMLVESQLDLHMRVRLRMRLGHLFDVLCGNPTGYYNLDMREPLNRVISKRLAEVNNYERRMSKNESGRGDTSQKGNWNNYRNEFVDDGTVTLSSAFFIKPPTNGDLKFDYVSTARPRKGVQGISVRRFIQLCRVLQLDKLAVVKRAYRTMQPKMQRFKTFYFRKREFEKDGTERPRNNVDPDGMGRPSANDESSDEEGGDDEGSVGTDSLVSEDSALAGRRSADAAAKPNPTPRPRSQRWARAAAPPPRWRRRRRPRQAVAPAAGGAAAAKSSGGLAAVAAAAASGRAAGGPSNLKALVSQQLMGESVGAKVSRAASLLKKKAGSAASEASKGEADTHVLGFTVPACVGVKETNEYWRAYRDSSYAFMEKERMGYLGIEKARPGAPAPPSAAAPAAAAGADEASEARPRLGALAPPRTPRSTR